MVGQTVAEVIASNNPRFQPGDIVLTSDGWQQYGLSDGKGLRKIDPAMGPVSWSLGVLGMVGLTAYVALLDIGKPKEGETVVVSAAAGAVGSLAGLSARHGAVAARREDPLSRGRGGRAGEYAARLHRAFPRREHRKKDREGMSEVLLERAAENVAVIRLNRPDVRNALNMAVRQ